jgi:MFS transporter, FHS family, L-fucose permease
MRFRKNTDSATRRQTPFGLDLAGHAVLDSDKDSRRGCTQSDEKIPTGSQFSSAHQSEVSIGSFLVNYFGLPEIAGFSAKTAAGFVSFFWGGSMLGRFLGAGLLQRFRPRYLLALCAIVAGALVTASMLWSGHKAVWSILALGFFNSIMFPTIFSLGEAELGPLSGSGSGILNMAIVGGAILPVIQGVIADRIGLHHAFVLPLICYLYIVFYALSGSKPNSQRYA